MKKPIIISLFVTLLLGIVPVIVFLPKGGWGMAGLIFYPYWGLLILINFIVYIVVQRGHVTNTIINQQTFQKPQTSDIDFSYYKRTVRYIVYSELILFLIIEVFSYLKYKVFVYNPTLIILILFVWLIGNNLLNKIKSRDINFLKVYPILSVVALVVFIILIFTIIKIL